MEGDCRSLTLRACLNRRSARLRLGQIPIFLIWYTFDSYPTRFNSVWFLTSILISSTFDSFSIWNLLGKRNLCSSMTWYNKKMAISLGMATSDCENNAIFWFFNPKSPLSNFTDGLILKIHSNFESSPPAKNRATPNFQHQFLFRGCAVKSVHFGTVR